MAVEARGFLFAAAAAVQLGCGVVPVRKPSFWKLPAATNQITYELEYGSDALEIHSDALRAGDRVVVIDDLLATGRNHGGGRAARA